MADMAPPAATAPEAPAAAPAMTESPPTKITGFVEGAYHGNASNMSNDPVLFRSFDSQNGNSFYLHALQLTFNHSFGPEASFVVDLDAGSDAALVNSGYAPAGTPIDVQEAYAVYSPGNFIFTAGKFVTYEGIEVIEGPLNPTLTRGYLFGLAEPYTHTGAKAHYKFSDQYQLGVGVINGWDTLLDNNRGKTVMGAFSAAPSPVFHAQLSAYFGPEQANNNSNKRLSVDLTGAVKAGPVTINFQGNYGSEQKAIDYNGDGTPDNDSWLGVGIQPVVAMGDFSLGARYEYFHNKHGSRVLLPGGTAVFNNASLMNFTVTPGYMLTKGFTVRGELRLDTASEAVFLRSSAAPQKTQTTFGVGAHYLF